MTRTLDLTIDSIAAGGDGVGRSNGLVVFVPRSAPGDTGRVRIDKAGRFARAHWDSIVEPGPERIDPPCTHYVVDRCGGCQLQHISYPAQLAAKSDFIRDALQRIAKRPAIRAPVRRSPTEWRYRRKLTLALRRRTVGDAWIAGLHPYDSPGRVFDLVDCPITDERVLDVWREIRAASQWLPQETELRGAVQISPGGSAAETSFLLEGGARWTTHERFLEAVPLIGALWWQPHGHARRRLGVRATASSPSSDDVDSADPAPMLATLADGDDSEARSADASFVQVNSAVAAELQSYVIGLALSRHPATAIDAYAGGGDTAVGLSQAGVRVAAIELDRHGAARGASRLVSPSRMVHARVEDVLWEFLPADVVILNPPRVGVHERVTTQLSAATPPGALIYVSCNPATLARDVARLPGFRIASVVGFDMFPQTAHVETVCELVPDPR